MASKAIGFLNFKFSADLTSFERAMTKAQKKLTKFGKNIQRTGKSLTTGLTLPIIGLGAVAIKTFADFEQSMLKVKAVSGATATDFKALTESAKELGSTTMFSASQVATLQFELSKLGFDPKEILASTEAILQLAQATDTELGDAAKTTAVALNSFNAEASEAQRFADIMALASSSAAMDMEKFAAALPVVGSTARLVGDDFETLSAKLQVLADSGMEGSKMGTHLKIIYNNLAKEGLTWEQGMQALIDSNFDLVTAQKLFGKNASNTALLLAENVTQTKQYTIANKEAQGTAKEMADIMDSGVAGAMRRLKSQTEGMLIQLGTVLLPIFTKLLDKLSSLVKWFSSLSDSQKQSVVKWALVAAAIGPVLIIIGKLSVGIGSLIGGFKAVGKYLAANPWILVAAAIAAVGLAVYNLFKGTEALTSAQDDLNDITQTAESAIMGQKVEVDLLTQELKTQGLTLADKEKALKKLQIISPQYYGGLDAATLSVESLNKATQDYTASLLSQAKLEASKEKLIELNKDLIDLEDEWLDARSEAKEFSLLKGKKGLIKILDDQFHKEQDNLKIRISSLADEYISLTKNTKARIDYGEAGKEGGMSGLLKFMQPKEKKKKDDGPTGPKKIKRLKLAEILTKEYANTISGLGEKISDLTHVYNNAEKGTDDFNKSSELLFETQKSLDDITEKVAVDTRTPFEIDIDKLEKNHKLGLNELKETQLTEQKSSDDFDKILENAEMIHLVKMKGLYQLYGEDVVDLDTQIVEALLANQGNLEEDPFANYRGSLGKLGETIAEFTGTTIKELEEALMSMAEKIGENLSQGAEDFEAYGNTIKGILRDVIGGIISAGVMEAVRLAITGNPLLAANPWAIPIIAGAAAGIARTAFNSLIPEFEHGGIVTGPTTALIGESGPEAVIPLDKLNQYMGGSQNITVEGRLVGTDIYLSNERTKFNRNRTV